MKICWLKSSSEKLKREIFVVLEREPGVQLRLLFFFLLNLERVLYLHFSVFTTIISSPIVYFVIFHAL